MTMSNKEFDPSPSVDAGADSLVLPAAPDLQVAWFEYFVFLDELEQQASKLQGKESAELQLISMQLRDLRRKFEGAVDADARQKAREFLEADRNRLVAAAVASLAATPVTAPSKVSTTHAAALKACAALAHALADRRGDVLLNGKLPNATRCAEEALAAAEAATDGNLGKGFGLSTIKNAISDGLKYMHPQAS